MPWSSRSRRTTCEKGERLTLLTNIFLQLEAQLVAEAVKAGLCRARPRSLPPRLRVEGHRFVLLMAVALDPSTAASLASAIDGEVRDGSFACAAVADAERILAVWRVALRAFAARHAHLRCRAELERALERLRKPLLLSCARAGASRCDIVVIGGSAGGLLAVSELLSTLTDLVPATLLIVLHTSPKGPGLTPVILSRTSEIQFSHPTSGGELSLGQAYVAPPGLHLEVPQGRLGLSRSPHVRYSRPAIDVLFQSAAVSFGSRVVSVLVSGTGRDGSDGTVAVSASGGFTMAQTPTSAEFGGMPASAIATGAVHRVAHLGALRGLLSGLISDGTTTNT